MEGWTPSSVVEAAEKAHEASCGRPALAQPRVTSPVNPPEGANVTVKVADWPAKTATLAGAIVIAKSLPWPVESGTVCGLPTTLSGIVRVPLWGPGLVGAKVTVIVHVSPGASVAPEQELV